MKHCRSSFWLILFISTTVISQEWPVYSPSNVISVRDPANSNLAEIPLRSIIINDKYRLFIRLQLDNRDDFQKKIQDLE